MVYPSSFPSLPGAPPEDSAFVNQMLTLCLVNLHRAEALTEMKRIYKTLGNEEKNVFRSRLPGGWMEELAASANTMLASRLGQSLHAILNGRLPEEAWHHVPVMVEQLYDLRAAVNHPERLVWEPQPYKMLREVLTGLKEDMSHLVSEWKKDPRVPISERQRLHSAKEVVAAVKPFGKSSNYHKRFVDQIDYAVAFHEMRAGALLRAALMRQQDSERHFPTALAAPLVPQAVPEEELSLEQYLAQELGGHGDHTPPAPEIASPQDYANPLGSFESMQHALLRRRGDLAHMSRDELPRPSFSSQLSPAKRMTAALEDTLRARGAPVPQPEYDFFTLTAQANLAHLQIARDAAGLRKLQEESEVAGKAAQARLRELLSRLPKPDRSH